MKQYRHDSSPAIASHQHNGDFRYKLLQEFLDSERALITPRTYMLLPDEIFINKDLQLCLTIVIDETRPLITHLRQVITIVEPLLPQRRGQIEKDKHMQLPIMSTSRRYLSQALVERLEKDVVAAKTWSAPAKDNEWIEVANFTGWRLKDLLIRRTNIRDETSRQVKQLEEGMQQLRKDIDTYELYEKTHAIEAPVPLGSKETVPHFLSWKDQQNPRAQNNGSTASSSPSAHQPHAVTHTPSAVSQQYRGGNGGSPQVDDLPTPPQTTSVSSPEAKPTTRSPAP